MRLTPFEFNGETYHLLLNGAAMFNIYDRFGYDISAGEPIKGNSRDAFEAVCWYLEELATQGELYRRRQGFEKQDIPGEELFQVELMPLDVPRAKAAIRTAICAGFFQEETEKPKEIDKGLMELEKKTDAD